MIWQQFIAMPLEKTGMMFDYPSVWGICFPMIRGAHDHHWAIHNGLYWMEQAGYGGDLNVWNSLTDMISDVYSRIDEDTGEPVYVRGSHFFFKKRLE
jgi:hypothetical protein